MVILEWGGPMDIQLLQHCLCSFSLVCNVFFVFIFFEIFLLSLGFNGLTMMWLGIVFWYLFCLRFTELLCSISPNFHQSLGKFCPLFLNIFFCFILTRFFFWDYSCIHIVLFDSYCTIIGPWNSVIFFQIFSISVLHIG